MFRLIYTDSYTKRAVHFFNNHRHLIEPYEKTLKLLEVNPYHPSLRLHALSGKLKGLHSISINLSYRITLHLLLGDNEIVLINIGEHDLVYR